MGKANRLRGSPTDALIFCPGLIFLIVRSLSTGLVHRHCGGHNGLKQSVRLSAEPIGTRSSSQSCLPARIELCAGETLYVNTILNAEENFDVVVIDGAVRIPCARALLPKLKARGIIVFDHTEWYPNLANFLCENGFYQTDFSGFGFIYEFTSCTSLLFRTPYCFLKD